MKFEIKKTAALIAVTCLSSGAVLSASESSVSQDLNDSWEQLKEDTLQFWSDLTGAVKETGRSIDGQIRDISTSVFAGKWSFVNGKYTTTIECLDDGTMTLEQTTRFGSKKWSGTYEVKVGSIVFSVKESTDGVLFKSTKTVSETWTIKYAPSGFTDMKFSSDDIPDDANGYDFSAPTLFSAVEE